MIRELNDKVGQMTYEHLFAGIEPPALVRGGVIAHGEEEQTIRRGTLLGKKDGKLYVYDGTEEHGVPDCVLTDDVVVGTTYDENVTVYISGNFNGDALIMGGDRAITQADEDVLRTKDIFINGIMPVNAGDILQARVTFPTDDATTFYEKKASELQADMYLENGIVHGTLKYIADYSSAGFGEETKKGNFIGLDVTIPEGATCACELVGAHNPDKNGKLLKLDASDHVLVARIADPNTQYIRIVTMKDDITNVQTFVLTGLTLEGAPD